MIRIIAISMCFLSSSVFAEIVVSNNSVNESYSQNVKVVGEFLVGVQLKNKDNKRLLHVLFPKDTSGFLCIALSSIDGKYKATLSHQIETPVSGTTKINFKSNYPGILSDYSNQEIAISSSIRPSCDSHAISKRLVSSWSDDTSDELILLIRSNARKDVAYIPAKNNYVVKSKCKKIRKSYNVSYDKYCSIKGLDLSKISQIEVVRKNLQPIESEIIKIN